ncbi:cache domain-containing protein [Sphingopyxis sp. SE2]|uniref:sensor histidine kinase n=1 Tax=unclassified Sphingopyxis TaxID=2614943 RepID=UPI00050EFD07|nr:MULTISPECIES: ATP-binding protein [unclassified Sphingopyxis]KGB58693.1 Periplasmic sensor signal transduction histidine kinase precursor [Sphingopyxis sp. LC363]MDT7528632.1 cache domain-containing protein [Sphingopyxis sp. SE2]
MSDSTPIGPQANRRRVIVAAAAGLAILLVAGFALAQWAAGRASAQADLEARQNARAHASLLESELQKFRLLPRVLTEFPDVRAALADKSAAASRRLDRELEQLAARTDATVIYVLDAGGTTIAASNWRAPTSFVGQNYRFRPYFQGAMQRGAAELFALGTVSGRPGLYLARRVTVGGRQLGVIVLKVEFDKLEARWADSPATTLVTDAAGIVVMSSDPRWRFRSFAPISAEAQQRLRATRSYGEARLAPLPADRIDGDLRIGDDLFRQADERVSLPGSTLRLLQPAGPARASAGAIARVIFLILLILVGAAIVTLLRFVERQTMRQAAHEALEREVAARTRDLRTANEELRQASERQAETDRRYRAAREELAQASRLGSIGQITAGVAHEINQPVAAIRTFAENALAYLNREQAGKARGNLDHIVELTARVGAITGELRNFARRAPAPLGPVPMQSAIDGALLLIGDRLRAQGIALDVEVEDPAIAVHAGRVRLEQVLINLLQNAAEAVRDVDGARVTLLAHGSAPVLIDICDNGPGVPAEILPQLFTPFVTGRPDGLGLGLAIASDIMSGFGGTLTLIPSPLGGAGFRLTLRPA